MAKKTDVVQELCDFYTADLFEFAKYINPHYSYGDIHEEIFYELQHNGMENLLFLIPRAHLKSHCIAVWVVWMITRNPDTSIVYVSAGMDLADAQMYAIKNMFMCTEYRDLWPEMFKAREADRDKWTATSINTDHPMRKEHGIRDSTLTIKTVKSNATGLHCDILVYDDIVVPGNAYTALGRKEVQKAVAEYTAIKNPGALTRAVGTRYDERDIYGAFIEATIPIVDDDTGEVTGEEPLWWVMTREVENVGNGRGEFLWPRVKSATTGKWYGFDARELARKRAEMLAASGLLAHFYAQYYNEPNSADQRRVDEDYFQYYEAKHLRMKEDGKWYYRNKRLTLAAGMDLAYNENTVGGDFTAIVVVGMDEDGWIYVLALEQFKTVSAGVYYSKLRDLFLEWDFRYVYMDVSGSGKVVKREVERQLRKDGMSLAVRGQVYTKADGAKEERFATVLEPRYEAGTILHPKGGLVEVLEDQILKPRPVNDDLEDALFIAVDNIKPVGRGNRGMISTDNVVVASNRFGGRRRA